MATDYISVAKAFANGLGIDGLRIQATGVMSKIQKSDPTANSSAVALLDVIDGMALNGPAATSAGFDSGQPPHRSIREGLDKELSVLRVRSTQIRFRLSGGYTRIGLRRMMTAMIEDLGRIARLLQEYTGPAGAVGGGDED